MQLGRFKVRGNRRGVTPAFSAVTAMLRRAACAGGQLWTPGPTGREAEFTSETGRGRTYSRDVPVAAQAAGISRQISVAPSVAVIGGGLAGLTAARVLKRAGARVTIYEASSRVGGRVLSVTDELAPGLVTELGGEFIDSDHTELLALVSELGLPLIDTQVASENDLAPCYFFAGRHFSEAQVIEAFEPVAARMRVDAVRLSPNISMRHHSAVDKQFDQMSIAGYLQGIGADGWLRNLLEVSYVTEYGLDADAQSCLNMLSLLSLDCANGFHVFGDSDQRYKVRGGNARITSGMAKELDHDIEVAHQLISLRKRGSGFQLDFALGSATRTVDADFVVLAIPFTALRDVELSLDLPSGKRDAIQNLGYGTNEKVVAGMRSAVWRDRGWNGDAYSDLLFQTGWDSGRLQDGGFAYTFYLGGSVAAQLDSEDPLAIARRYLADGEAMFPGMAAAYTGSSIRTSWLGNPLFRGAYSCYKPGQWTTIRGTEAEAIGNLYFAGEHCSSEFQGFMNGAVETGRKAAEFIIARLR